MSQPKKKRNYTLWILGAIFIFGGAFAFFKNKDKKEGEAVELDKVETRTIVEKVAASGRIYPVTEVKISSDVSGEIVELYIEEGDSVKVGQLLARIDPDAFESQVERGMAGVNSAKAQSANARSQVENLKAQKEQIVANLGNVQAIHKRNTQLHAEGVISDADLESSQANLQGLEANIRSIEASIRASQENVNASDFAIKSAQATLKELKTSLKRTDIYAPMTGIVSLLAVEKGERVVGTIQMSGTELMRIADLSQMEVQVDVSENDIPRVTLNDEVEIEVDAYVNRKFIGKVTEIAHSASNMTAMSMSTDQVTNFVVTTSIDASSYNDLVSANKPFPFRPGMSASVEVKTNQIENVVSVPIQAVTTREFDKDGKPKDREDNDDEEEDEKDDDQKVAGKDDIREVIFVKNANKVNIIEVETGIQDDEFIQIKKGLTNGQEIVIGPYAAISRKLKDGTEVYKKEKKKKKEGWFNVSFSAD